MWLTPDGSPFNLVSAEARAEEICASLARSRCVEGEDGAFFVCRTDAVTEAMAEWRRELGDVHPFYAVKCNPDGVLLRCLASLGASFDCASTAEIQAVLAIPGVSPQRILFANPCKTRSHIRAAAAAGVRLITLDNSEELVKIAAVHPNPALVLRLAVSDPSAVCQLSNKFGCDPGAKAEELLRAAASQGLEVAGLSFHVGSGCRDPRAFEDGIRRCGELTSFGRSLGLSMGILDLGGGFPGFGLRQDGLSFPDLAAVIRRSVERDLAGLRLSLVAEPGRFFATAAFSLVANIIARTEDKNGVAQHLYINDGVYGSFNCKLFDHASPEGAPLFLSEEEERVAGTKSLMATKVWGPTCDGLDLVLEEASMPPMDEGDWLFFLNMGAYTSAAATHFNGFPPPTTFYVGSLAAAKLLNATPHHPHLNPAMTSSAFSSSSSSTDDTDCTDTAPE